MSEQAPQENANEHARSRRWQVTLGSAAGLLTAAMAVLYFLAYPGAIGKEQPIPFSHRIHAGVKDISCFFCHPGAADSPRAGVPPLQTCMLCHDHIIRHFPPVAEERRMFAEGKPVEWVRVNHLPEFVYFDHQMHLLRGIDCGRCHGDVRAMDRIKQPQEFTMGFCIQCHRDNDAPTKCYVCHR
jgi:Cytochrome c7 and related cytochrome c